MEKTISTISDKELLDLLRIDDDRFEFIVAGEKREVDEYNIVQRTEQFIEVEKYCNKVWVEDEKINKDRLDELLGLKSSTDNYIPDLKKLLNTKRVESSSKMFSIFLLKKLYLEGFKIKGYKDFSKSERLLTDIMKFGIGKTITINATENKNTGEFVILDGEALFLIFELLDDTTINFHKRNCIGNFQITVNITYV